MAPATEGATTTAAVSFRDFLRELEAENDLLKVNIEVDPHLELAAIIRKVYETGDNAPLFDKIKGRNSNRLFRILGAPVGVSKLKGKPFIRIANLLEYLQLLLDQKLYTKSWQLNTYSPSSRRSSVLAPSSSTYSSATT